MHLLMNPAQGEDGPLGERLDTLHSRMAHKVTSALAAKNAKAPAHVRDESTLDGCGPPWDGSHRRNSTRVAVLEKTQEFFQMCDIEEKGFITRRDMQRLHGELPLSADDLENVFDTLDTDGNGYLTLDEFSTGFSEFLFGRRISVTDLWYQCRRGQRLEDSDEEEEKNFCVFLENLGASNIFEDPSDVRSLWAQLRRDEPHLLSNFEEFLSRITVQIKAANQEKREMENALQRKAATHNDELQRLYEEMEHQIKLEKDQILHQVKDSERFLSRSQGLEQRLSSKEMELEQLVQKQRRLEHECQELHSEQEETRVENVKLKQTNQELLQELERTSQELLLAQEQLHLLHQESARLQDERDMEMYRITEGLQRERISLLKQLDLFREMNKHLRHERDMSYLPRISPPTLSPALVSMITPLALKSLGENEALTNEDDEGVAKHDAKVMALGKSEQGRPVSQRSKTSAALPDELQLQRVISIEEDPLPQRSSGQDEPAELQLSDITPPTDTDTAALSPVGQAASPTDKAAPPPSGSNTPSTPRKQPVGKETFSQVEASVSAPDRLFKIILVGNSSVGKTSVLQRFCDECFVPGTSATIGIDYSVKTLAVENCQVALQMWDTAGQERYRSITKQFFRKADGVVIMYDITSQQTFTAVRNWLVNVQEGAGGNIPIMLLGNKMDRDCAREVQPELGEKLAKDFQLIFYECSAFSGQNITAAMVHLARVLKEQEDEDKERTVQLIHTSPKRRFCC